MSAPDIERNLNARGNELLLELEELLLLLELLLLELLELELLELELLELELLELELWYASWKIIDDEISMDDNRFPFFLSLFDIQPFLKRNSAISNLGIFRSNLPMSML